MHKEFIAQKDEICYACGKELPTGSKCIIDEDEEVICEDCWKTTDYAQQETPEKI